MRCGFRLALCACLLLIVPIYLLALHLEEICNQYRAGAYLIDWLNSKKPHHEGLSHYHAKLGDKVIVMARLEEEPAEWVEQELPEYGTSPQQSPIDSVTNDGPLEAGNVRFILSTPRIKPKQTNINSIPPSTRATNLWPTSRI